MSLENIKVTGFRTEDILLSLGKRYTIRIDGYGVKQAILERIVDSFERLDDGEVDKYYGLDHPKNVNSIRSKRLIFKSTDVVHVDSYYVTPVKCGGNIHSSITITEGVNLALDLQEKVNNLLREIASNNLALDKDFTVYNPSEKIYVIENHLVNNNSDAQRGDIREKHTLVRISEDAFNLIYSKGKEGDKDFFVKFYNKQLSNKEIEDLSLGDYESTLCSTGEELVEKAHFDCDENNVYVHIYYANYTEKWHKFSIRIRDVSREYFGNFKQVSKHFYTKGE